MFRSFHSLLLKIRDLLRVLDAEELRAVERALCTGESISFDDAKHATLMVADFKIKDKPAIR